MNSSDILATARRQEMNRREAKRWLKRVYYQTLKVEAERRALNVIEARVNNAVGKLENDGASIDRGQSNKKHEDMLLSYAQKNEDLEKEELKLSKLKHETRMVISKIRDDRLESIAEHRYVDCLAWRDVEKIDAFSHSHIMRLQNEILNRIAVILLKEEETE
jgi:predicted oxidoreductase